MKLMTIYSLVYFLKGSFEMKKDTLRSAVSCDRFLGGGDVLACKRRDCGRRRGLQQKNVRIERRPVFLGQRLGILLVDRPFL